VERNPEKDRATHPIIYRLYRRFCRGIYGWAAPCYDLVADLVSGGQWDSWLRLVGNEVKGGRILELGFGTGRLQVVLADRADCQVHGLELSREMHAQCSRRMNRHGKASRRVVGDGTLLPYAGGAFDMVVATFPEEYIVHPSALRELHRVLAPGGKALLMGRWISLRSPWLAKCFPVFYRAPTDAERQHLIGLVRQCGLVATIEDRVLPGVVHHLVHLGKE